MIPQLDPGSVCSGFIISISCFLSFAPCNPITGRVLPICTDSANVDVLIRDCLTTNNSAVNQTLSNFDSLYPDINYNYIDYSHCGKNVMYIHSDIIYIIMYLFTDLLLCVHVCM